MRNILRAIKEETKEKIIICTIKAFIYECACTEETKENEQKIKKKKLYNFYKRQQLKSAKSDSFADCKTRYTKDNNLEIVTYFFKKGMCNKCTNRRVYADSMPPVDSLFHNEIWSHGLAAYAGGCTKEEIESKLQKINESIADNEPISICCAHKKQHIGEAGIYVRGNCQCVSNIDLASQLDSNGRRYYDSFSFRAEGIIYTKDKMDFTKWSHMEIILQPKEIVGIWVKEILLLKWPTFTKTLKDLCHANGMIFHVIREY